MLEPDRAPLLFNLVFGEGVINDATTVALLRTVQVMGQATPSVVHVRHSTPEQQQRIMQ